MTWQDPSGSETARQLEDMEVATNGLKAGDTESGEERKNSNTSIRTIQSTPKYTECMGADKPFANISNRRMMDNITRAVSHHGTEIMNQNTLQFYQSIKSSCSFTCNVTFQN